MSDESRSSDQPRGSQGGTMLDYPGAGASDAERGEPIYSDFNARRRSRSRGAIVLVIITSLLATALMQSVVSSRRAVLVKSSLTASQANLNDLNSFSLALLLGGLRGPLVMYLWSTSESQKQQHDLEDFDTKVEMIRLLQPEFDTVHMFEMWNKAYNISVQMANLANKYSTIIDALNYGYSLHKDNDINILFTIATIYFEKLGQSNESEYYRQRVMEDTRWRVVQAVGQYDPARPTRLEPMLDPQGMLLQKFVTPEPQFSSPFKDGEKNDGSALQYLIPYQPFPYGINPMALGYNYYKRAQVLQSTTNQRHLQMSEMVLDSRPAVSLMLWGKSDRVHAHELELKVFGFPAQTDLDAALTTASIGFDHTVTDPAAVAQTLYDYQVSQHACTDALKEYARHLKQFAGDLDKYGSHVADVRAMLASDQGDAAYLQLAANLAPDRPAAIAQATAAYRTAVFRYDYYMLRFINGFLDDRLAAEVLPKGYTRRTLENIPEAQLPFILQKLRLLRERMHLPKPEDIGEFEQGEQRAMFRLAKLQGEKPQAASVQ